jgi:hypothetical protein
MALISTVWAAVVLDYEGYMAARFFQGFGVSPGATVGMAIINEYVIISCIMALIVSNKVLAFSLNMKEVKSSGYGCWHWT